jgi:hypothetical protein
LNTSYFILRFAYNDDEEDIGKSYYRRCINYGFPDVGLSLPFHDDSYWNIYEENSYLIAHSSGNSGVHCYAKKELGFLFFFLKHYDVTPIQEIQMQSKLGV